MTKIKMFCFIFLTMCCFALFPCAPEVTAFPIFTHWEVAEFQPNIPNGGRANTFAVHPTDASKIYVTSESGGLFRSTNAGATWRHVDALPCFRTLSVAYLRTDPNVVLVTTADDFRTTSGGGIWRSADGGFNWTLISITFPAGISSGRLDGFEITVAPDNGDIYVGSSYGVLKSTDKGLTWSYQDVFGGGDRRVVSVVALGNDRVIGGGPAGVKYSSNGGTSWQLPAAGVGGIWDLHALGRSPVSNTQAFVVNSATNLFFTENGGQNWTQIASAPGGGGGCGGITFARAVNRTVRLIDRRPLSLRRFPLPQLDLFFGNRCGLARLRITKVLGGGFDYSGTWQNLNLDHSDTRDIAFDNSTNAVPILLGTDGGLHKTADGGANWTFTGGGVNGFNALQITEVQGQLIEDIGRFDFYFGTQDNDLWSSGTDGTTWTKGICCEGFYIEAEKKVPTAADSKVTFVSCAGCGNFKSDPLFTNITNWSNPPGDVVGNPMIIKKSQHIQGVNSSGGFNDGFAGTDNLGGTWSQYASFPEARRSMPKLGRVGYGFALPAGPIPDAIRIRRFQSTVVYQAYRGAGWAPGGFEINRLLRVSKNPLTGTATVTYPAMNNFGGLGINPTMFAWYQVFAVDPGNYLHVIAPDAVNQRVMETRDGGENWTEIPTLTNLVTDGGRLRFTYPRNGIFPILTAISFSPQNPNFAVAGTSEGGLYLSSDNGANWFRIPNSEGVTYATGFSWKNAGDVVISTYGRGLWRLKSFLRIPHRDWELLCGVPCLIRPWPWERIVDPLERVVFDRGILVFEGRVVGATIVNRVVKELYVSNGSSVVFSSDDKDIEKIKIIYTNKTVGFRGSRSIPKAPEEATLMKGVVLDSRNRLIGAVFGDKPMMMFQEKEIEDKEGSTKSPIAEKPYLRISTSRFNGADVALPNELISITVVNLRKDTDVVLYIDDKPVSKLKVDSRGSLKTEVRAPVEFGLHSITVRAADDLDKVIDGAMFIVTHADESKRGQRPPR